MNREKFKQAVPVHEELVTLERKLEAKRAERKALNEKRDALNVEIAELTKQREDKLAEFRAI